MQTPEPGLFATMRAENSALRSFFKQQPDGSMVPGTENSTIEVLSRQGMAWSSIRSLSATLVDAQLSLRHRFQVMTKSWRLRVVAISTPLSFVEKVWMTLGLMPPCVGNDQQRLVYDGSMLPEFDVTDGEVSSDYHFKFNRNVCQTYVKKIPPSIPVVTWRPGASLLLLHSSPGYPASADAPRSQCGAA